MPPIRGTKRFSLVAGASILWFHHRNLDEIPKSHSLIFDPGLKDVEGGSSIAGLCLKRTFSENTSWNGLRDLGQMCVCVWKYNICIYIYIYGTWWLSPQGYVFLAVDGWIVFFPELCEGTPPFGWIWTTSLRCHLILKIVDKDLIRGIIKWPPSGYVIPADQCASPFGAIIHHNPLHRFLVLNQYNGMIERFEHYSYTHTC